MKKALVTITVTFLVALLLASFAFTGVVKQTKSQVTFRGFGTITIASTDKITSERKLSDTKNDFKGKGIMGGLAGKTILKSGQFGEIIDLPAMTIYNLDHKKKEYTIQPIEKFKETLERMEETEPGAEETPEEAESDIKIIRTELKAEKTAETKVINQFSCTKYVITWVADWENVKTGEKGTDRLIIDLWTTPYNETIRAAEQEEMAFSKEYFKAMGLDIDKMTSDVLGTRWLAMMQSFGAGAGADSGKDQLSPEESRFVEEMKKIEGYPVVTDGKYFTTGQKQPAKEGEESGKEESESIEGKVGKLASGLFKKKPKAEAGQEQEPALAYYVEVISISPTDIDAGAFQVPAGYKKKD